MAMHQMLGPSFGPSDPDPVDVTRSLRFNPGDSPYLNRTPSSAGNRRQYTISCWVKRSGGLLTDYNRILSSHNSDAVYFRFSGSSSYMDALEFGGGYAHNYFTHRTVGVFRDVSGWYHLVVAVDTTLATAADRVKIYVNGVQAETVAGSDGYIDQNRETGINTTSNHTIGGNASGGESIDGYLANFEFVDGDALLPTKFGAFNDDGIWGPVEYSGSYGTNGFYLKFADNSSDAALGTDSSGNSNTWTVNNLTAAYNFGLTSAAQIVGTSKYFEFPITYATTVTYEYFIKIITDGTYNYGAKEQGTNEWNIGHTGNSVLFGNFNTGWTTFSNTGLNNGAWHFVRLTTTGSSTSLYVDGSLIATNASGGNVSTGSQVTNRIHGASSGEFHIAHLRITTGGTPPTTGVPDISTMNAAAGSGGTLVFYDKLDDIASSGTKTSDGGNVTITMNGATVGVTDSNSDSLIDTPTNLTAASGNNVGNYCTLSPLKNSQTLSNGNLNVVGGSSWQRSVGTLGMYSGKYYWEYEITASNEHIIGVGPPDMQLGGNLGAGDPPGSGYGTELGQVNGTGANGSWSNTGGSTAGDLIGIAFDADNGNMYVYKNGNALNSGIASHTGLVMPQVPVVSLNGSSRSGVINFGQRPFAYTPPTGYVSLCTTNLPGPTIADGSDYFDTQTYTGTGASQTLGGLSFSADLFWRKCRSTNQFHNLVDSVRGLSNALITNDTYSEQIGQSNVSNVTSTGYDIGTEGAINTNGETYVAWLWDAGSSTVSNTDGSITSSVRANQTAGFSIVTYTGTGSGETVGHGLNAAPEMIVLKDLNATAKWKVLHIGAVSGSYAYYQNVLHLDTNESFTGTGNSYPWGGTAPTSSVFSVANVGTEANRSGSINNTNYVAYCWTSVAGYSAFGSYTGNGSADGPFVFTGMRPKWILLKRSDGGTENWTLWDTERNTSNVMGKQLYPNLSNAEADAGTNPSYGILDSLSSGFKIRGSHTSFNLNGGTFVYAAFAEHPLKTARAR